MLLASGDTLLLFSDGISEAANPEGEEFGDERLIQTLCGARELEADTLLDLLFAEAREFAGAAPQTDDMTALIVRCKPAAAASGA